MADLGNLHFGVHLQDMTDADADKIKKKLENLSVSLKIDGNNVKVSNTDIIKKQIEDAVKSVSVSSVKVNVDAVKQQIEGATQNLIPQVKVTLLKDNLSTDIQSYLDTKSFSVKISISKADADNALKNLGSVSVPVLLKIDKKTALEGLKKSLLNMTVPIGVRMKSSKDLTKDIQERMKNASIKVGIDVNKTTLRSNVAQALKGQTFKANLDLVVQKASVQQAIRQAFAQAGLNYNTSASDVRQNLIDTRSAKADAYVRAQKALEDYRRAQIASANAADKQSSSMERVNRTAERQKGIMAGIREQVANAYALYRVGRFLEDVIRISGEFQQQHVALQTILGDAQKADVLFQRIKGLAVESPFKFGDLTKYAKQLAAFSIPYEEMFDTLKRFGDLSAGLGVEMGRIILAYGQVRSAEFLKGTELRQFTEAGIPLVTELARRYTELEGTLVSVGDVYDRISKKEVPFADVKAVLWDLTNEGGRFFNMQAVLTDTLKGKLDKLIDSYEIFLSEVGNSNNDALGGTLEMLTGILDHWREIQNAIMAVVAAYGTYKAALIAVSAVQKTAIKLEVIQRAITSMQFLGKATNGASAAFKLLGNVVTKNPIGLFAGVMATMVGVVVALRSNSKDAKDAIIEMNAKIAEEAELTERNKQKAQDMATVMTNEKKSIEDRSKAYETIKSLYPSIFEGMTKEQALLMDELELRNKITEAAKEETKEKLKADLVDLDKKIMEAKQTRDSSSIMYDRFGNQIDLKSGQQKKKEAQDVIDLETERLKVLEKIALIEKKESELQNQRTSKWYAESKKIAEDAGFKNLIPTDEEVDVWEYFDRIKQGMDDIEKKKELLNKESSNYSTMLGNLDDELEAYKKIYYDVLGGKNEEAVKAAEEASKKRTKEAEDEAKRNKKLGEEAAKAFADGVKSEIERIASQWDLYKQLFEATGNKGFAMTAFDNTQVWDEAALKMRDELEKAMKGSGLDFDLDFDISDVQAKGVFGDLYDSWKAIKDRIEKNGIDLKVNVADILGESRNFEQQVQDIVRKYEEKIEQLRKSGQLTSENEGVLRNKMNEEIANVRFEEFKESSDWVKVFDDLDRVSNDTLDTMIAKVEEFAKQAQLSEEVTKQLVDAMAKLRDEAIDRNPFEGFADAWKRLQSLRDIKKNGTLVANGSQYRTGSGTADDPYQFHSKKEVDDGIAEANDDLKDSALSVADKFQAVADASDLLSGLFENMGISMDGFLGSLSSVIGGAASGAQTGAGIASALGVAGPWGAIAGAAVGMLSSVFALHDKALQKEIEASERREEYIKNVSDNLEALFERNLGGVYTMKIDSETKKLLQDSIAAYRKDSIFSAAGSYYSNDSIETAKEALREDSYYDAQLAALKLRRDELEHQMELEDEKKKTDKDKMADYQQEIKEMEAEIDAFVETMASELYGIDFKGWAEQLAESLVDAWASGEDAVQAYKDTVNDILRDLGVSVISQKIIEPLLNDTMKEFLAQFEKDNGKLTDASMEILAGMADGAEYAASATEAYIEGLKKLGIDLSDTSEEAKSGLSKGIEGVTEDTANLLGSYLNAIRQDVSVKRSLVEKLISEDVPKMNYLAEAQLRELSQIQANTAKNVTLVGEIRDLMNRVVDKGSNKLKV